MERYDECQSFQAISSLSSSVPTFSQTPTTQHRGSSSSQRRGSASSHHRNSDTQSDTTNIPGSMNEILERAGRESCESITKWIAEQQQAGLRLANVQIKIT